MARQPLLFLLQAGGLESVPGHRLLQLAGNFFPGLLELLRGGLLASLGALVVTALNVLGGLLVLACGGRDVLPGLFRQRRLLELAFGALKVALVLLRTFLQLILQT